VHCHLRDLPPPAPSPVLRHLCWACLVRSVDLYFNGHDHIQAVQTNPTAPNTTFITMGSSGKLEAVNLNTSASTVTWGQAQYRGYSIVTLYATYVSALCLPTRASAAEHIPTFSSTEQGRDAEALQPWARATSHAVPLGTGVCRARLTSTEWTPPTPARPRPRSSSTPTPSRRSEPAAWEGDPLPGLE